jgi:uroporphyrinogen decarboxylase
MISKRERLEAAIRGEKADRLPVAFWQHFPVDDQTPKHLVDVTISYQKEYDNDFVKVSPTDEYMIKPFGTNTVWTGDPRGCRIYQERLIKKPEDWKKIRELDPNEGTLRDYLDVLNNIGKGLQKDTPFVATLFGPLNQAKNLAGFDTLMEHIHHYPEFVLPALKIMTKNTVNFAQAALNTGISGFFYALENINYRYFDEITYEKFGKAFDLEILDVGKSLWLNILHHHGESLLFNLAVEYPVQVVQWHALESGPSLGEAQNLFKGQNKAILGGLQRKSTLLTGTPVEVIKEAQKSVSEVNDSGFILGPGCMLMLNTPRINVRTIRDFVDKKD